MYIVYVSHRSQIQFEERITLFTYKFSLSNNYMSSLRTTTCDALFVSSDFSSLADTLFIH